MSRLLLSRRNLLRSASSGLLLPFLGSRKVYAQDAAPTPKRLIVFMFPQGTVMDQYIPIGDPSNYTLPYILEPLIPWRDRSIIVTGVDNLAPQLNSVGNAHYNANLTFLTGRPFYVQDDAALSAGGPSIDQYISNLITGDCPYPRLDFAIGGTATANGLYTPSESSYFWHGVNDPVAYMNDPFTTLVRIFGDDSISPSEAWATRARRTSILDKVMQNFSLLDHRLGAEDKIRLDAHKDKLDQLYNRMVSGTGECDKPNINVSPSYDYANDDNITAPIMNDIMVQALSCNYSKVATIHFANAHDSPFGWLSAANNGAPIVDYNAFSSWHEMVHADYQPGAEHVYHWYMQMFADLLQKLNDTQDADGENMLDTSMVLGISEYSSGRHWNTNIPMIFAGNFGSAQMGRWVNHLSISPTEFQENGSYAYSGFNVSQAYVSMLHAFGFTDQTFGYDGAFNYADWVGIDTGGLMPQGPLPGLLV